MKSEMNKKIHLLLTVVIVISTNLYSQVKLNFNQSNNENSIVYMKIPEIDDFNKTVTLSGYEIEFPSKMTKCKHFKTKNNEFLVFSDVLFVYVFSLNNGGIVNIIQTARMQGAAIADFSINTIGTSLALMTIDRNTKKSKITQYDLAGTKKLSEIELPISSYKIEYTNDDLIFYNSGKAIEFIDPYTGALKKKIKSKSSTGLLFNEDKSLFIAMDMETFENPVLLYDYNTLKVLDKNKIPVDPYNPYKRGYNGFKPDNSGFLFEKRTPTGSQLTEVSFNDWQQKKIKSVPFLTDLSFHPQHNSLVIGSYETRWPDLFDYTTEKRIAEFTMSYNDQLLYNETEKGFKAYFTNDLENIIVFTTEKIRVMHKDWLIDPKKAYEEYLTNGLTNLLAKAKANPYKINSPDGNWYYLGDEGVDGFAHGIGNAIREDGLGTIENGRFENGNLIQGVIRIDKLSSWKKEEILYNHNLRITYSSGRAVIDSVEDYDVYKGYFTNFNLTSGTITKYFGRRLNRYEEGAFTNNKLNGNGLLITYSVKQDSNSDRIYIIEWERKEGLFKEGKLNGQGTRHEKGELTYIGNFYNDNYQGYGEGYTYPDKVKYFYKGQWTNGKPADGKGISYYNGIMEEAVWKDGKRMDQAHLLRATERANYLAAEEQQKKLEWDKLMEAQKQRKIESEQKWKENQERWKREEKEWREKEEKMRSFAAERKAYNESLYEQNTSNNSVNNAMEAIDKFSSEMNQIQQQSFEAQKQAILQQQEYEAQLKVNQSKYETPVYQEPITIQQEPVYRTQTKVEPTNVVIPLGVSHVDENGNVVTRNTVTGEQINTIGNQDSESNMNQNNSDSNSEGISSNQISSNNNNGKSGNTSNSSINTNDQVNNDVTNEDKTAIEGYWCRDDLMKIYISNITYFQDGGNGTFVDYGHTWNGYKEDWKKKTGNNLVIAGPKFKEIKFVEKDKWQCKELWFESGTDEGTKYYNATIIMIDHRTIKIGAKTYTKCK